MSWAVGELDRVVDAPRAAFASVVVGALVGGAVYLGLLVLLRRRGAHRPSPRCCPAGAGAPAAVDARVTGTCRSRSRATINILTTVRVRSPVSIRVVTDSSCDLPQPLVDALRIEIVPLTIRFGDEELVDRVELSTDEFWAPPRALEAAAGDGGAVGRARSRRSSASSTARGATGIVCINLSSHLSATMQAAQVAAAAVAGDIPVQVIDSQSASMGLGNLCLTAARRAADGDSLESIVNEVVDRRDRTKLFATLDTLEFLKRGGRVGNARALLGTVLSIKPVIEVRDGVVEEAGKVRTRSKALEGCSRRRRPKGKIEHLAVLHGNAPDRRRAARAAGADLPARRHHHRRRRPGDRHPRRTPRHRRDVPGRALSVTMHPWN